MNPKPATNTATAQNPYGIMCRHDHTKIGHTRRRRRGRGGEVEKEERKRALAGWAARFFRWLET